MRKLFPVLVIVLAALILYSSVKDISQQTLVQVKLRHLSGGEVAFIAWQLSDGSVETVKISQKEYLDFVNSKNIVAKPEEGAKFLMASGGIPAIDTEDGWPHLGDAYEYDDPDFGKVLVVAVSDNIDWSYSGGIASDPGVGKTSELLGVETGSSGNRIYLKPGEYDLNNLPKIRIDSAYSVSVLDNTANVLSTSTIVNKMEKVREIIPNRK